MAEKIPGGTMIPAPAVGDVWAVNTGLSLASELIRAGEALQGLPSDANHVVGVNKCDKRGVWWGIEGSPRGVSWALLASYQHRPEAALGNSNAAQPKTDQQRAAIALASVHLLGADYSWPAIADDTAAALHLPEIGTAIQHLWETKGHPALVCSAMYAYVYQQLKVPNPAGSHGDWEHVEPAHWWSWNDARGWL